MFYVYCYLTHQIILNCKLILFLTLLTGSSPFFFFEFILLFLALQGLCCCEGSARVAGSLGARSLAAGAPPVGRGLQAQELQVLPHTGSGAAAREHRLSGVVHALVCSAAVGPSRSGTRPMSRALAGRLFSGLSRLSHQGSP